MSDSQQLAIRAKGLRKAYRVYERHTDALIEAFTRKPRHQESVALDNIDLELKRGEIVGVLGRNGAGKSTLLKVIAGTLERSAGELEVNGRITAILELGTGFHPEYTGRENIYMGGICLGMSRAEIDKKIENIIDFSELKDVIDQPFKTYSTGMQARLTFSTAISVDPDILIVDEALSVGDAKFQLKCFSWLQKLREKNTTILLVSHDTNTITSLCDRAIILEGGQVYANGDSKRVSVLYQNLLFGRKQDNFSGKDNLPQQQGNADLEKAEEASLVRYGSGEAKLLEWGIRDPNEQSCSVIESGSVCKIYMVLSCESDIPDLSCGFAIKDRRGTVLWGVTNLSMNFPAYAAKAGEKVMISADCVMWLAAGNYFVTLGAAHLEGGEKIDFVEDGIEFKVISQEGSFTTSIVNLQTNLKVEQMNSDLAGGAYETVA